MDCGHKFIYGHQEAGFTCYKRKGLDEFQLEAWQIYEWNAFDQAAQSQIAKDKCLEERTQAVTKNPEILKNFIMDLRTVWLGIKKSELIADTCLNKFWHRMRNSDLDRYGAAKAYEMAVNRSPKFGKLSDDWIERCSNKEAIDAMASAREIFQFSLPVINDPRLIDLFDQHRNQIVSKVTGKPISDEEIIESDLRNLDSVQVNVSKEFLSGLKGTFQKISDERREIGSRLDGIRKSDNPEIPDDLKEFLFQDGTLTSTLIDLGQVSRNASSIQTSSGRDMSSGALCLLSKYESNLETTLVDMGSFVATFGAGWVKFLQAFGKLEKGLSALKKLGKAANAGLTASGSYEMRKVPNSCSHAGFTPKLTEAGHNKRRSQADMKASASAKDLPPEVGFGKFSARIPKELTPSCMKLENENLGVNNQVEFQCAHDLLFALAQVGFGTLQLKK